MRHLFKRVLPGLCAAALLCVPLSGCNGGEAEEEPKKKLFDEPVTFTIMTYEHQSQQVNPSGIKYKAIQEATNVTLEFTTADLRKCGRLSAKKAGDGAKILYKLGALVRTGKRGNAYLYRIPQGDRPMPEETR